jgi:hypothetical protein
MFDQNMKKNTKSEAQNFGLLRIMKARGLDMDEKTLKSPATSSGSSEI